MAKWLAASVLLCLIVQDNKFGNSYLGKAPPELVGPKDQWVNAAEGLQLGTLKGKVVWLEFGFLKCAPCRKMMPVMDKWHKEWSEKGLVIIDVDDGSTDDLDEVQKDAKERGTKYAILWDKDRKNCDKYGVEVFPRAYLIGVEGTVLWEGLPNSALEAIETLMKAEFAKVKK